MLRRSLVLWKPKTLPQMFRLLKLAGAHPDVLWGIDAQKAQHNGEEMIRLETLMHQRDASFPGLNKSSNNHDGGASPHSSSTGTLTNEPQQFLFWLKAPSSSSSSNRNAPVQLKAVQCTLTPLSESRIVKQQLMALFNGAGILDEFDIAADGKEMNLESVLRFADERQTEHIFQSGSLYIRGGRAVEHLRRFGVLLVVEEEGVSYLVSLPEMEPNGMDANNQRERIGGGAPQLSSGGTTAAYLPARSIVGPNGEIDPDVQDFMTDRGMRPFDLRMAGSHASVERFVSAFERLERMYEVHRGRALRPSVCVVMSLKSPDNFIAPDGSIVLAVQRMPAWEEFLLSLPQDVWADSVRKHTQWRVGRAPLLQERKRNLVRVADIFGFYRVTMEAPVGGRLQWQQELTERFLKEETMIRRAIQKYNLKSELLKQRGEIRFVERLFSSTVSGGGSDSSGRKEIGFRISGDGTVVFNQSTMNTGQVLRVLKDNLKRIAAFHRQHEDVVKALEHLSRNVPVDFSVDMTWKLAEEGNLVNCLQRFVLTVKSNEQQLGAFLNNLMSGGGAALPAGVPVKKRMVWVISNKFDTMPSGVVFIPYDVDFESIKKLLLSR